MSSPRTIKWSSCIAVLTTLILLFALESAAQVSLNKISTDPFTNTDSQHATDVEPDSLSFGSTIVSAFQQGRFVNGGGCSDIGWATSLDGGQTWQQGSLPGLTKIEGSGPFDRISDPAVAFDAAHAVWMIASLPLSETGQPLPPMAINHSSDGINWDNPVFINRNFSKPDKTWLACDNNTGSPFFGHCYAEWDDNGSGDVIWLSTSTDGGFTWSAPVQPLGGPIGLGGQPQAKANGGVIVTSADAFLSSFIAYSSRNGGTNWTAASTIATPSTHLNSGGLRDLNLPSAAIDSTGTVYVAWHDCRFRAGCSSNDIVFSTSRNGQTWSQPHRVPIDPTSSTVDHFIPGLEIESGTGGRTAHLGLSYYYYPQANCSSSTCQLMEGYVSSPDGGRTWTAPTVLAGPIKLSDIANTDQGFMVGDYQSVSFAAGKAFPVFSSATAKTGSMFHEDMFSPVSGLTDGLALYTSDDDKPVPGFHSDHLPPTAPVRVE